MGRRDIKISVVVPIFNEDGNIDKLYNELKDNLEDYQYEIIFVDDGSTDNSFKILENLSLKNQNVKVVQLAKNFGQSAAFQAGFDKAKNEIIVTIDGDLQNDPKDIPSMIDYLLDNDFDMVVGWRKKRHDPFFSKKIPSMVANKVISKVLKLKIHDTGCSLKVFKKSILEDLNLYGQMHRFIPYLLYSRGYRIGEVVVQHRERYRGKSKYGFSRIINVLLDLFTVKFLNDFSTNPIIVIGGLSFFSFLLGILSFVLLILMKVLKNVDMTGNPLLLISVFLFLISVQLLMIGLLSEIMIRTYFETTRKNTYRIKRLIGDDKK
ncbi:MAG: Undecaprenyl-phosphate 4-deoxy-4-formamido-L-arabinose transferase [candidate division TA06 bacterium 32_111]|uniref:Undecaprenyl-phosphate 4-deoxy-4-formamido-L-arabinose transferase n=2 Tax=Bacteria candidate phyla TaxID=1783234 RepID=A0A101I2P4_UNCT6|nr:MAG: Undecaprenyl-phosphate 4-deoxy-4-formamido-L-arabinose transferase [candidate division TA06 bacterium 32_111]KUK86760.1 MAG: Undecaprenyl-phosphate 4-deoxy-4-formamido-L-arabinose transferase [candidate division TA06 bacterium 34_109]HAF08296.1 glycosyltransferase [candidate division WOR-3 bacterium]HCP16550.1 glycosyltransferase [candidate division WOR-3 bacterium]